MACERPGACAKDASVTEEVLTAREEQRQRARKAMPPVQRMIILQDFESWAQNILSEAAWAYYRSAADQERCEEPDTDCPTCSQIEKCSGIRAFAANRR